MIWITRCLKIISKHLKISCLKNFNFNGLRKKCHCQLNSHTTLPERRRKRSQKNSNTRRNVQQNKSLD